MAMSYKFCLHPYQRQKHQQKFEKKLLIKVLDILFSGDNSNFIYQSNIDSSVRKEAYSKGYFLKTLKSNLHK
jgi:hypothetical protein